MRALLFFVVATFVPTAASAQVMLTTEGGQAFSFAADGSLQNTGGENLWAPGLQLNVNGSVYTGGASVTSADGRTATFPSVLLGGLSVQRTVYVPAAGTHDYARWLDVLANSSGSAVAATVTINTSISSFGGLAVIGSSSGDTTVSTADDWATFNPGSSPFGGTNPLFGVVVQGAGARVRTATESGGPGGGPGGSTGATWTFSTMVPAFSRVSFVTFVVQKDTTDMAALAADATLLAGGPDGAMVGLDSYLDSIVNFPGDTPGAPVIRFAGPTVANEGDTVELVATVTDDGIATPTWSWDTDGDGTFGELTDVADYTSPSSASVGGVLLRIGVQATNGTTTSQRYRVIEVMNIGPTVNPPDPPATTASGADFGYQMHVTDPGGARDVLTYACTRCPGTMTVSADGFVSWSPTDHDVTMPAMPDHIVITVTDAGGASATLMWDLAVLADHPPTRPTTLYPSGITVAEAMPRLVAGNAMDADGDLLMYVFDLDTVATFDSPAVFTSPPVPQTDGYTAYMVTSPLVPGTQYYWRVHANDGSADGESAMTSFYTQGTAMPDAGTPDGGTTSPDASTAHDAGTMPPPSGGCSTAPGTPGAPFAGLALVALAALATRRRRRS